MENQEGQKPKSRGKNIAIIVLSLLAISLWIAFSAEVEEREKLETRINGCQELVVGINTLFGQERNDYKHLYAVMDDWFKYQISSEKAQKEINILIDNLERRVYQYNLVRDKYEHICFEVGKK
jgi:hypothetical protein